jgi:hypothetical protein
MGNVNQLLVILPCFFTLSVRDSFATEPSAFLVLQTEEQQNEAGTTIKDNDSSDRDT